MEKGQLGTSTTVAFSNYFHDNCHVLWAVTPDFHDTYFFRSSPLSMVHGPLPLAQSVEF